MGNLNKFLIGLIILIVLLVGGLGYYTYFVFEGNEPIEEKPKEELVPDDTLIKEDAKKTISELPYSQIVKENVTYVDLNNIYILSKTMNSLTFVEPDANNKTITNDKDGVKYPKYTANSSQYYGKLLGLTVAEIENMDVANWKKIIGKNIKIYMFDAGEIKNKIAQSFGTYGTMFDLSFVLNEEVLETFDTVKPYNIFLYDKNIDKVVCVSKTAYTPKKGTTGTLKSVLILSDIVVDNQYKIEYVEAYLDVMENNNYNLNVNTTEKIVNVIAPTTKEIEEALKNNQDKLDKYEIIFKKVDNKYQFDSIKKI